ncbi:hypothetical protein B0H10DRAFT_1821169 [Mycena sp. CBHHK59/15]|nr:hypothetical protein B0H10DRAFT_1821169 [Mycena sp. CBHHK59/15]
MSSVITLYDLPSTVPGTTCSPNTAKTRYSLNFKGIRHKTVWVEFLDVEPLCKKIGAASTGTKPDGQPFYTLPVIYDPAKDIAVSGSIEIARYLDSAYPSLPRLMPEGTTALHYAFTTAFEATLFPLYSYALPATLPVLNPASQDYFRCTREALFGGQRLEDVTPQGDDHSIAWQKVNDGFGQVDAWISKNGENSKYIMGENICYADILVAGFLRWARTVLSKEQWAEIASWHGGRWETLMKDLEKYNVVV